MLDRSTIPTVNKIEKIDLINPNQFEIAKFTKLFFMKEVPNETSRLELYFDAGTIVEEPALSSVLSGLLLSGTLKKSSIQINAEIDALGGFVDTGVTNEFAIVTIECLRENLLPILQIVQDAINNLAFIEKEVTELINNRKQKLRVNLEKVNFLAQRAFQERIFNNSSYSKITQESDFDSISIERLKLFFESNYLKGLIKVVLIGNFNQDQVDRVIDLTGAWSRNNSRIFEKEIKNLKGNTHIAKEGALQSAFRIGRILFNKTHEDYCDFMILNTVLGDYFGSRLMANIREDKGYTYGIRSMVGELSQTGYFLIAAEVGKEVKEATFIEIEKEFKKLQDELMDADELEMVKNYMLGQLLKSADGAYALTDLYLGVESYGLDLDFYNKLIESINSVTPERIKNLARQYLIWDDMTIVSVG